MLAWPKTFKPDGVLVPAALALAKQAENTAWPAAARLREAYLDHLRKRKPHVDLHRREDHLTIGGKRHCRVTVVEPVGTYAVPLIFDDLHSTGIFTWDYLHELGTRHDEKWALYEAELKAKGLSRDRAGQA